MMRQQVIDSFSGRYSFLSNFYQRQITYRGIAFPTAEHAYQWAKCRTDSDRERVLNARTPGDAKRVGRHVMMRTNWDKDRVKFMRNILAAKFKPGSELAQWLIDTGDAILIEGNNWGDTFWGQCRGEGENWLGQLLMELRAELVASAKL